MGTEFKRVVVVGASGSGKSYVASRIAAEIAVEHVELDAVHFDPDWKAVPERVTRTITEIAETETWVIDGNYSGLVGDISRPHAELAVWIDYRKSLVMYQVIKRSLNRVVRRELLWGTNRETFRRLFGRESIVLWTWSHYAEYREWIPKQLVAAQERGTDIVILRNRRQTATFLATSRP